MQEYYSFFRFLGFLQIGDATEGRTGMGSQLDDLSTNSIGVTPIIYADGSDVAGYIVSGAERGPMALAVGRRSVASEAFHRLAQLESLPRMRGRLLLVFENALEQPKSGLSYAALDRLRFDGNVTILADATDVAYKTAARNEAYWTVLRLLARLGMIDGRGVPPCRSVRSDMSEARAHKAERMMAPASLLGGLQVLYG